MPEVQVIALGSVRKLVGFSQRTISFEGKTVADLLRALGTLDGADLYGRLVADGKLRSDYAVVVDGMSLRPDQLESCLKGKERVVTMAILRPVAGG